MLAEIGALVGRIRTRRRLSLSELAAKIGIDVAIVERLEGGRPGVTTTQLDAIARALDLDPQALRRAEEVLRPAPSVFLRHQGMQDFHDTDLAVLDNAIEHARTLSALGKALGEIESSWSGPTFRRSAAPHDTPDAAAKHGYHLAGELRKYLNLGAEPVGDLRAVAEDKLCIAVVLRRLSTRGVFAVKAGDAAAIVLSSSFARTVTRTRASIAHELCHILHDPEREGVHVVLDVENDGSIHANEQRARAFAAELLLPRGGLNRLLGLPSGVIAEQVAKDLVIKAMDHFGASWQITVNHLCNRHFIDMGLRTGLEPLEAHALRSFWATPLPGLDEPSLLVAQRAERAHRQGLITDGDARGALGIEMIDPLPWDEPR
jgi:transcriptional regulator with XRE-family HTH domain